MKMSPLYSLSTGVVEFGIAVIDRNFTLERFTELNFGPGEAEALRLGRDLETAAVPLHDVVVADRTLVMKTADAIQFGGSGTPGLLRFPRRPAEAAIVVGEKAAEDCVGRFDIGGAGQPEFAGQAILKSAPEALDAALGLRTVGRDVGDAELLEGAAELGWLAATGELFFERPVIVVTDEDAVAVAIEADRNTMAAQQAAEQAKIAASIFGGEEFGDRDFARGVVQEAEQGKLWAAVFEPRVGAAVEQEHLAFTSAGEPALAMGGSTAFARRADPGRAQQAAESLTTEGKMFDLRELLAEVMIVEAGVTRARELQDAFAHELGQTAGAGPAAAGVCQRRLPALPIARFQAP